MAELQLKDYPKTNSKWLQRLRTRHWAAKPRELQDSTAKWSIDDADKVLIVGEHKLKRTETAGKEAIVQVGGYIGEILEAQPFRYYKIICVSGCLIAWDDAMPQNTLVLAAHGYELFAFVEIILALTIMSYAQLGYDKDVLRTLSVH